jgi:hypothetical protein
VKISKLKDKSQQPSLRIPLHQKHAHDTKAVPLNVEPSIKSKMPSTNCAVTIVDSLRARVSFDWPECRARYVQWEHQSQFARTDDYNGSVMAEITDVSERGIVKSCWNLWNGEIRLPRTIEQLWSSLHHSAILWLWSPSFVSETSRKFDSLTEAFDHIFGSNFCHSIRNLPCSPTQSLPSKRLRITNHLRWISRQPRDWAEKRMCGDDINMSGKAFSTAVILQLS